MSLKPVGSADEENDLSLAVRLGWEAPHLGLVTFGKEVWSTASEQAVSSRKHSLVVTCSCWESL